MAPWAVLSLEARMASIWCGGEHVLGQLHGVLGQPAAGPLVADDLHVAAVDLGLQHHHLTLAEQARVIVFFRAGQQVVAALGNDVQQVLGLQLADAQHVEGDVVIQVAVLDDAVVGDDLHTIAVTGLDSRSQDLAVDRQADEHVDALGEHVLDLRDLQLLIPVGRGGEDRGADLGRVLDHVVHVAFPALEPQVADRHADRDGLFLLPRPAGRPHLRQGGQAHQQQRDPGNLSSEHTNSFCVGLSRVNEPVYWLESTSLQS
jgi:hypothetical protein